MLPLVEISVVVATLAVVVIAVAAVRALRRIEQATVEVSKLTVEIQLWVAEASELTREARDAVATVHGTIAPIRPVVERLAAAGKRTVALSAAILEEVEPPLQTAVAMTRALKLGTSFFLERLSTRFTHSRSATNGGSDNE